jgi:hypothetical protein
MPLKALKNQAPFFEKMLHKEKVARDTKMVKDQFAP